MTIRMIDANDAAAALVLSGDPTGRSDPVTPSASLTVYITYFVIVRGSRTGPGGRCGSGRPPGRRSHARGPLSARGAVNRASSRRAASGPDSLASPGSLVSTEWTSTRACPLSMSSRRPTSAPRPRDVYANEPGEGPRHSCRPQSSATRVDEAEADRRKRPRQSRRTAGRSSQDVTAAAPARQTPTPSRCSFMPAILDPRSSTCSGAHRDAASHSILPIPAGPAPCQ